MDPKIPIMVLPGTIWSFQVLNRVLWLWQPEAPKKVLWSTFFLRVYIPERNVFFLFYIEKMLCRRNYYMSWLTNICCSIIRPRRMHWRRGTAAASDSAEEEIPVDKAVRAVSLETSVPWVHEFCAWKLSFCYISFHENRLQTMLWHHNARVNSHQRWK